LAPLRETRAAMLARRRAEQRKLVTVLFADVVDFTVLSRSLDPEDTRTIMNAYFRRWHEHITAHGGVVEKFIGDAVMAVFGLHESHEDDPHRAIRSALGMRSALGELNAELPAGHPSLVMRVGIDTGEVVVSSLDDRPGQDFVVVGDTVNRAARIQAAAPPGGILISRDTHRHVRGRFSFSEVEPLQLKGIAEPVRAHLVGTERPAGYRLDEARGVEGVETRTIGREASLRQLQDRFWDVADEGRWQVVTVVGDAGVGKSRLLLELDRWLAEIDQPLYWFRGRAAPASQNAANSLLRDVVAARLGIRERDEPAAVVGKLEEGFAAALGTGEATQRKAHLVGFWLGFELSDSAAVSGYRHDPQGLRKRASVHLAEYFAKLAARLPVVILLEDLHWADEGSLAWIDAADEVLGDCRVLVVATARPSLLERHPHWGEGLAHHARLPLDPLSRRESGQLLAEILQRVDHVPSSLRELLLRSAEGNPFHLEELVKWLIESGVIVTGEASWHIEQARLQAVQVPPTLRGVLQARVDALTPPEQLVLQRASVIGRVFWDDAVASFDPVPSASDDIADSLTRLRRREVVYQRPESAFDGTHEFLFKHAVLRDVTYESVLRAQRLRYHALAARWLEQITERTQRIDEYAALIAAHHDSSGDALAAARWYLRAASQASSVHALAEATRLLDRAAEVVPADEPALRFDVVLAREGVLDRMGAREEQRHDLDTLDVLAEQLDDRRRIQRLLRWASWHFHHSEYEDQAVPAQAAVTLARQAGLTDLEADALLWWGRGLTWKGAHGQAKHVLEQALARAREAGAPRLVGESLRYLAIVANNESEFPRAIALLEEARAAHRANNDLEGESTTLVQLGSVLFNQGRHREARVWLEECLPIFVASGHKYRQAVVTSNLGAILLQEGELGQARRLISEGLALCQELGDREGVAVAFGVLGDTYRRAGDHERAQDHLRRSVELALEIAFDFQASDAYLCLALDALDGGLPEAATELVDRALERARLASSPLAEARALVARAYACLALGRSAEAQEAATAAGAGAERLGLHGLVREVEVLHARIALCRGDLDDAVRHVETAGRGIDLEALEVTLRPGGMLLARWEILARAGSSLAPEALRAAGQFLDEFAARIDEPDLRRGFLTGIPAHVQLRAALSAGAEGLSANSEG
ncbi:MAG TPA: adenylate/guanylate cyclase domain-containing protein, partial [Candidatus Nanopelagicales bacterium]